MNNKQESTQENTQRPPSYYAKIFPHGCLIRGKDVLPTTVVAWCIMRVLAETGDTFRPLGWDEYKEERIKGGNPAESTEAEKTYFHGAMRFCASPDMPRELAEAWK